MTCIALIPFAGAIISTFAWTYVFAQRGKSDVNRAYLHFAGVAAAWAALDFLTMLPVEGLLADVLEVLSILSWMPIGVLFLNFACVFVGKRRDLVRAVGTILAAAAAVLANTTDLVYTGHKVTYWGRNEINGPLFVPVAVAVVVIPACYGVWLLWRKLRSAGTLPHEKRQIRLIVRGAVFTICVGVFTDVVMGNLPCCKDMVPDWAAELTVILNLHVYWAVRKHNLMTLSFDRVAAKLLQNASDGAVVVDRAGDVLMMNESAREILGAAALGPGKLRLESLLPGYCPDVNGHGRELAVGRGEGARMVAVSCSAIMEEGVELGRLVLLRDVTERRRAEDKVREQAAELAKANARLAQEIDEKNDFLRVVSHDLGAPLRNIVGLADSIVRRHSDALPEEAKDRLARIRRNAEAEIALIGELLDLSRIRTRRGSVSEVDIGELAREAAGGLSSDLEAKRIRLELAERWPRVACERARIARVFQNLIDNAAKYMHRAEGGVIEVGWREEPERYVFWVRDNGPGIGEEDRANLFKVFRRGRAAAESGVEGKGVGLAAVKAIVETHGGEIWVESEPGKGSTFFFTLAKRRTEEAPQAAESVSSAGESWAQIDAALIRAKLAEEGL